MDSNRLQIPTLALLALLALLTAPGSGSEAASLGANRGTPDWCGAKPTRLAESLAVHRSFARRVRRQERVAQNGGLAAPTIAGGPSVRQVGHVAVIEDDGSLVSQASLVDLSGRSLQFQRRSKKLRASKTEGAVASTVGDRLDLGDDDSLKIDLPFTFKLFGRKHRTVWVNSDGNLTFGGGDAESTARSVARVLNGPPRVAALFVDLDPSGTSGDSGVFARIEDSSARITWKEVPEFGKGTTNTFQVTLYPSGRIKMAWDDLAAREAVVGVSPGGSTPLELVDLTADLPFGPTRLAVLERFSTSQEVDDLGVAKAFLDHFEDDYSHVIVWLDFTNPLDGAFAYEFTVNNQTEGLGVPIFDFSHIAGSSGALQSFVQMGTLARYRPNVNANVLSTMSTMDVLGHEAGHRWMAFTRFEDQDGFANGDLLGRDQAHWSYHFDTDASVMEGNDIRDNGDGTFTTVAATTRYSNLDRYLMGLIPAEEVGEFFYIRAASGLPAASAPEVGQTIRGTRQNLSIEDVIRVEGPRVPNSEDAPKIFKTAFVLLGRKGEPPSRASIDHLQAIRKRWPGYFKKANGKNGKVVTNLVPLDE